MHACGHRHTRTHTNRWSSWYRNMHYQVDKNTKSITQKHTNTHPMTVFICSSTPSCLHSWSLSHTHWRETTVVLYQYILPRSLWLSLSHSQSPSLSLLSLSDSVVTFSFNSLRTVLTGLSLTIYCWDLTMRERTLKRQRETEDIRETE